MRLNARIEKFFTTNHNVVSGIHRREITVAALSLYCLAFFTLQKHELNVRESGQSIAWAKVALVSRVSCSSPCCSQEGDFGGDPGRKKMAWDGENMQKM